MRNDNEIIFKQAKDFLNNHLPSKLASKSGEFGKALIGVVGQTERPGKANQVIFADTQMIKKHKLDMNAEFMDILRFLTSFNTHKD
ncbi:MAG: hypothetical protein RIS47_1132 [Bacteroidota bacterium]